MWVYGFKLHFVRNDKGGILSFCLTPGNIDGRDPKTVKTLTGKLFRKLFADRGYMSQPQNTASCCRGRRCNSPNRLSAWITWHCRQIQNLSLSFPICPTLHLLHTPICSIGIRFFYMVSQIPNVINRFFQL
ncbi:MAG: transposase [Dysgonamonadaceae bacterium]|nr:transposase [Dysgonamonadaceae bacterium]